MIRYIFWDLDGTLIRSGPGIISSAAYALGRLGVTLPESELNKFIGPSLYDSFTQRAHLSDDNAKKAITYYREVYTKTGLFDAEVYAGIPETLEKLRQAGMKHAAVTSKMQSLAERVLEHFGIAPYLEKIVGPTPEDNSSEKEKLIRSALDYFQADPSQAVMVGDRCYDINGARAAGIHSIGVLYGYGSAEELKEAGAEQLAETPEDILQGVNKLA